MANNNESRPQGDELVTVSAEKRGYRLKTDTPSSPKQAKSSGNGLLWFVVVILF